MRPHPFNRLTVSRTARRHIYIFWTFGSQPVECSISTEPVTNRLPCTSRSSSLIIANHSYSGWPIKVLCVCYSRVESRREQDKYLAYYSKSGVLKFSTASRRHIHGIIFCLVYVHLSRGGLRRNVS